MSLWKNLLVWQNQTWMNKMDSFVFEKCTEVNNLLRDGNESSAREKLIILLDYHQKNSIQYSPLLNHLIRQVGLYPYMDEDSSDWEDDIVYNMFKVNVGSPIALPLHREQYNLLKRLVDGENIAVSAPTSFGKSFIIDAFIKIRQPRNVMIIVPTIALTDETRRRIYKKFSSEYSVITTPDANLGEKNIFIFPQERALGYVGKIDSIDVLIVDEFYKSSKQLEPERSSSLIKAIIKLGEISKQRYYLAPNISHIQDNPFTKDMLFMPIDFSTVFLNIRDYYEEIGSDSQKKGEVFRELNKSLKGKTLIYAGSYPNIDVISDVILSSTGEKDSALLNDFADWLGTNYDYNWKLPLLVKRGVGIHNGALHRSLSQIQIKLFEEEKVGLNRLISTSSIIEGVNTSAENVIVWMTSGRGIRFNNFSYKNLVGRAGRMFKYFIGNIFVLAKQPTDDSTQLIIDFPEEILGDLNPEDHGRLLTKDQVAKISEYDEEMTELVGEAYYDLKKQSILQLADSDLLKQIAGSMKSTPNSWNGLSYLNSPNPDDWERMLYKILKIESNEWGCTHSQFVDFVKVISRNWDLSIPELLSQLDDSGIGLDLFFKLERNVSFKLAALVGDVNILQKHILHNGTDLSAFQARLSSAFLPPIVYQLEEYGLPRMISKRIQEEKLFDFEDSDLKIEDALKFFREIGIDGLKTSLSIHPFESYVIDYFYDGITSA